MVHNKQGRNGLLAHTREFTIIIFKGKPTTLIPPPIASQNRLGLNKNFKD